MHPTIAPDFTGSGTIALQVTKSKAAPAGQHWNESARFDVLAVESHGKPTMLITADGKARLVRPKARQSFNEKQVYVSGRTWHVATPFEQPLSVIVSVYEKALAEVKA